MFRLFILTAIIASAAAGNVNPCAGKPFPLSVEIDGCDEQPCPIVKGTYGRFHLEFVTEFEAKNLTTNVMAKVFGANVNYPVPDEQKFSCEHLLYGSYCPIHKGEDVGYIFELFIGTFYPEIALNVEVSLKDEQDRVVTCFNTDIKVMKAQST